MRPRSRRTIKLPLRVNEGNLFAVSLGRRRFFTSDQAIFPRPVRALKTTNRNATWKGLLVPKRLVCLCLCGRRGRRSSLSLFLRQTSVVGQCERR